MTSRTLGQTTISTRPLVLGGNVFGWTCDESRSFDLLDRFVDAGFTMIDTANVYSIWKEGHTGGESETVIGKWMKARGNRARVTIATKVGMDMGAGRKGLRRASILSEAELSLTRLQTDYIDLYQSHQDDPDTPVEETLSAYAELVRDGKVRWVGASNFSAERLHESHAAATKLNLPLYQSLQPQYNLCERDEFERTIAPTCRELGMGVISYFGLARGFLTGKYRNENDLTKSVRGQGVKKYMNERGFRILTALDAVALELNSNPARVALAWLMVRPEITAPIASATTVEQLNDLIAATLLTLSSEQIRQLSDASAVTN